MRLALLVLAYREPQPLRHALPIYRRAGYDVYVHLDSKADRAAYVDALGDQAPLCHFIDDRHNVFWAGFSMIEAELALVSAARAASEYDRYTLVSDDTFPLLAPDDLRRYIMLPYERIMIRKLEAGDPTLARYTNFYFFDHLATSLHGRPIESACITDDFLNEMARLRLLRQVGKRQIDIYYGSQWWSLTGSAIGRSLDLLDSERDIYSSFKYSAVPDEIMFQSLIGNFIERGRVRNGPVHVDWSKEPRPFVFTSAAQLPAPDSGFAFVRKVASGTTGLLPGLRERLLR